VYIKLFELDVEVTFKIDPRLSKTDKVCHATSTDVSGPDASDTEKADQTRSQSNSAPWLSMSKKILTTEFGQD